MARLVARTEWKPYRFFPWVEWRIASLESEYGTWLVDVSAIWTERRLTRPTTHSEVK